MNQRDAHNRNHSNGRSLELATRDVDELDRLVYLHQLEVEVTEQVIEARWAREAVRAEREARWGN